jgi:hypothetical protein
MNSSIVEVQYYSHFNCNCRWLRGSWIEKCCFAFRTAYFHVNRHHASDQNMICVRKEQSQYPTYYWDWKPWRSHSIPHITGIGSHEVLNAHPNRDYCVEWGVCVLSGPVYRTFRFLSSYIWTERWCSAQMLRLRTGFVVFFLGGGRNKTVLSTLPPQQCLGWD